MTSRSKLDAWKHPRRADSPKRPSYMVAKAIHPDLEHQMIDGIYKVKTPEITKDRLRDTKTEVYQLWCHSPIVLKDTVYECNNSMEAYFGEVNGHAVVTKTIECSKCRTAYAITAELGGKDCPVKILEAKVLNLNRNMKPYVDEKLDNDKNLWIKFHE